MLRGGRLFYRCRFDKRLIFFFRENHLISGRYLYTTHLHKNVETQDCEGRRGALATETPARAQKRRRKTERHAARTPTHLAWGTQAATHAGRRCARHPEKTPPRRIRKRASPECVLCYLDPGMQSASSLSQSDRTHERAGASRPSTCTHHSHAGHTVRYCQHAHRSPSVTHPHSSQSEGPPDQTIHQPRPHLIRPCGARYPPPITRSPPQLGRCEAAQRVGRPRPAFSPRCRTANVQPVPAQGPKSPAAIAAAVPPAPS